MITPCTYPAVCLTSPMGCIIGISELTCAQLSTDLHVPCLTPKPCFSCLFPILANVSFTLTIAQANALELCWTVLFSPTVHLNCHPILLTTSGCVQNPTNCHLLCCYHPGSRHYCLLSGSLQWPPNWCPHLCPHPPLAYSPHSSQDDPGRT